MNKHTASQIGKALVCAESEKAGHVTSRNERVTTNTTTRVRSHLLPVLCAAIFTMVAQTYGMEPIVCIIAGVAIGMLFALATVKKDH